MEGRDGMRWRWRRCCDVRKANDTDDKYKKPVMCPLSVASEASQRRKTRKVRTCFTSTGCCRSAELERAPKTEAPRYGSRAHVLIIIVGRKEAPERDLPPQARTQVPCPSRAPQAFSARTCRGVVRARACAGRERRDLREVVCALQSSRRLGLSLSLSLSLSLRRRRRFVGPGALVRLRRCRRRAEGRGKQVRLRMRQLAAEDARIALDRRSDAGRPARGRRVDVHGRIRRECHRGAGGGFTGLLLAL